MSNGVLQRFDEGMGQTIPAHSEVWEPKGDSIIYLSIALRICLFRLPTRSVTHGGLLKYSDSNPRNQKVESRNNFVTVLFY